MYVIVRVDGRYVTRSGSLHSYTRRLEEAQVFASRQAAEENRCPENERVLAVTDVVGKA